MVPPLRRRRPPQGDRQPGPGRHRRHRLDRHRRRPRPAASSPRARADGRRDVPARRQRPGPRPRRGPAGPDDRGRQRRRRLDLRDARAGRPGVRRPLRHASSAPRTASTSPASARPPAPRTGGSTQPARARAGAGQSQRRRSRSSRPSSAATTAATSTSGSARCAPEGRSARPVAQPGQPRAQQLLAMTVPGQSQIALTEVGEQAVVEPADGARRVAVGHPCGDRPPGRPGASTPRSSSREVIPSSRRRPEIHS